MCKEEARRGPRLPHLAVGRTSDCAVLASYSRLAEPERGAAEQVFRKFLAAAPRKLRPGELASRQWGEEARVCCMKSQGTGLLFCMVITSEDFPEAAGRRLVSEALALAAAPRAGEEPEEAAASAAEGGLTEALRRRMQQLLAKYDSLTAGDDVAASGPACSGRAGECQAAAEEEPLPAPAPRPPAATGLCAGPLLMHRRRGAEARWFRLREDRLEYFRQESDAASGAEPRGILALPELQGVIATGDRLVLQLGGQELVLSAAEGEDLRPWSCAFQQLAATHGLRFRGGPPFADGAASGGRSAAAAEDDDLRRPEPREEQAECGRAERHEKERPAENGDEASGPLCEGLFVLDRGAARKQVIRHFALYEDKLLYFRSQEDRQAGAEPSGGLSTGDIEDIEVSDVGFRICIAGGVEIRLEATCEGAADVKAWQDAFSRVLDRSTEGASPRPPAPPSPRPLAPPSPRPPARVGGESRRGGEDELLHSGNLAVVHRGGHHSEVQHFYFYRGRIEYFADAAGASLGLCLGRVLAPDVRQVRVTEDGFSLTLEQRVLDLQIADGDDLEVWLAALKQVLGHGREDQEKATGQAQDIGKAAAQEEQEWNDELEQASRPAVGSAAAAPEKEEEEGPQSPSASSASTAARSRRSQARAEAQESPSSSSPGCAGHAKAHASLPSAGPRAAARSSRRELFLNDGPLRLQHDGRLVTRYCRLFRDRIDFWARDAHALQGARPEGTVSLSGLCGLETVGSGFLLCFRTGHRTGMNVGDGDSLRAWCGTLLSLLAARSEAASTETRGPARFRGGGSPRGAAEASASGSASARARSAPAAERPAVRPGAGAVPSSWVPRVASLAALPQQRTPRKEAPKGFVVHTHRDGDGAASQLGRQPAPASSGGGGSRQLPTPRAPAVGPPEAHQKAAGKVHERPASAPAAPRRGSAAAPMGKVTGAARAPPHRVEPGSCSWQKLSARGPGRLAIAAAAAAAAVATGCMAGKVTSRDNLGVGPAKNLSGKITGPGHRC